MDSLYEDLSRLPTENVTHIVEWLTEKVDALCSRLKAEPKEGDEVRHRRRLRGMPTLPEHSLGPAPTTNAIPAHASPPCPAPQSEDDECEAMCDVDLWGLAPEGGALTVNAKWLTHLQSRLLGEDGHPRKVTCGEGGGEGRGLVRDRLCRKRFAGSVLRGSMQSCQGACVCLTVQPCHDCACASLNSALLGHAGACAAQARGGPCTLRAGVGVGVWVHRVHSREGQGWGQAVPRWVRGGEAQHVNLGEPCCAVLVEGQLTQPVVHVHASHTSIASLCG